MKRKYEKPTMNVEIFEANEYIATCYTLKCNVNKGLAYHEMNGEPGYQKPSSSNKYNGDLTIFRGHGCGEIYSAKTDTVPTANAKWDDGENSYDIFLWDDLLVYDKHFTKVEEGWITGTNNAS